MRQCAVWLFSAALHSKKMLRKKKNSSSPTQCFRCKISVHFPSIVHQNGAKKRCAVRRTFQRRFRPRHAKNRGNLLSMNYDWDVKKHHALFFETEVGPL